MLAAASAAMLGVLYGPRLGLVFVALVFVAAVVAARPVVPWIGAIGLLLAVILFIPIRRYYIALNLPFQAEPYRLLLAAILGGWVLSLLADARVRLQRSFLDVALVAVVVATVASAAFNPDRVQLLQANVTKSLLALTSYVLLFVLLTSVVRTRAEIDRLLKVVVAGASVVALMAVVEARTHVNVFDHLGRLGPFLQYAEPPRDPEALFRARASAQHPIALSAALVMLLPIAIYLARTQRSRLWYAAPAVLVFGMLGTISRTGVVMLAAIGVVALVLRPREVRRLLPLLPVVFVLAKFAVPGALGTLKSLFTPAEGLIASQSTIHVTAAEAGVEWCNTANRLADVGPALDEASRRPLFGYGYGTRIIDSTPGAPGAAPGTAVEANACVLDDQWLGTLLDTGLVGVAAWLWLFVRFTRRVGREARADPGDRGLLLGAIVAAVVGYAAGMFFFDSFAFLQVTLLLFVLLAFGAILVRRETVEQAPVPLPRRHRHAMS